MNWWGTNVIEHYDSVKPGLGIVALIAWICLIVVSITLHELGHGWAAIACGDNTPRELGHMTLNPVKHMGIPSLVVLAVTGLAWGMMPVNPLRFKGRYDEAIVAVAGPMMNVLLAMTCLAGAVITALTTQLPNPPTANPVFLVFYLGLSLNISLAILNLIPVPPLDGSRILAAFIPPLRPVVYNPQAAIMGIMLLVVISRVSGGLLFHMPQRAAVSSINAAVAFFKGP